MCVRVLGVTPSMPLITNLPMTADWLDLRRWVEGGGPEEDCPSLLFLREEDNTDNGSTVSGTILIMEAPFQGNTDNDILRNN
jgi:hypothetical protein